MELNKCYAYLDKMMAHQPTNDIDYAFYYWDTLAFIHLSIEEDEQFIKCLEVLSRRYSNNL